MQAKNKVFRGQCMALEPECLANDAFNGIACDGFGGKTLGNDQAKSCTRRVGRCITRRTDNKQSPSGYAFALKG